MGLDLNRAQFVEALRLAGSAVPVVGFGAVIFDQ
jgi:hypothetical protein